MTLRRLVAAAPIPLIALVLAGVSVYAAASKAPAPKPAPPGPAKKAPTPLAPEIYQVNPIKVNPSVQPNIMILGQHLTPSTTVVVGGRDATTVQAPDANHLLVKLPDNLSHGSYMVEVTNEAGTAVASDPLVVEDPAAQLSNLQMLGIGSLLLFLVLVMRLARTPSLA